MKAVIFDFGGTLDTDGIHWNEKFFSVWSKYIVGINKPDFDTAYRLSEPRVCGMISPMDSFIKVLQSEVNLQYEELTKIDKCKYNKDIREIVEKIPEECYFDVKTNLNHLEPVLSWIHSQSKTGVVSNFYGNLNFVIEELGLSSLIDVIIDSEAVGVRKPSVEIFRLAVLKLDVLPEECYVIGDSYERDIIPAKKLGCRTIWLKGNSPFINYETNFADYTITSLNQLTTLQLIAG